MSNDITEIEKQFFDTFEIEPKRNVGLIAIKEPSYPKITDHILLELICILNKHYSEYYQIASMIVGKYIEEVKKSILNDCIEQSKHKDFRQQVQALFKEN